MEKITFFFAISKYCYISCKPNQAKNKQKKNQHGSALLLCFFTKLTVNTTLLEIGTVFDKKHQILFFPREK